MLTRHAQEPPSDHSRHRASHSRTPSSNPFGTNSGVADSAEQIYMLCDSIRTRTFAMVAATPVREEELPGASGPKGACCSPAARQ